MVCNGMNPLRGDGAGIKSTADVLVGIRPSGDAVWKGKGAMRDFPNLDDFSVTEYGDIHMVDPRVVDVLKVAGTAHIEYCYENDEMMCSIDSNPDDGKWRWMIIQRRPYMYMDDGNLGGTPDLMTAYEEAKDAYLSHRATMDGLRQRLNHDVVIQMPEDVSSPFDGGDWYHAPDPQPQVTPSHGMADEANPRNGGGQPTVAYQGGSPHQSGYEQVTQPTMPMDFQDVPERQSPTPSTMRRPQGQATFADVGNSYMGGYAEQTPHVEQTPLQAFDDFEDMLDRFFEQDEYEAQTAYPEHCNVEFGDESYSVHEFDPDVSRQDIDAHASTPEEGVSFDFDMDIDEFLGLDSEDGISASSSGDRIDDMFARMIDNGLSAGNARWNRDIRGDPK